MKKRSAKERIYHSQKQLTEFSHFSANQKLENFTTVLKPAIARLISVLSSVSGHNYKAIEELNKAFLLVDIQIISYYDLNNTLRYINLKHALKIDYPEDFEIIDKRNGKHKKSDGTETFSVRIAIDYSLDALCKHWLEEIPEIIKSLPNN